MTTNSQDEQSIGSLFKLIHDRIKVNADSDLKRHGLTLTQSRVLVYLEAAGGTATQKELEDHLRVSHPTVTGIVSRMEQNGFLETHTDPSDRRNKIVSITRRADLTGRDMTDAICQFEKKLVSGLSENELSELKRMLIIILSNL